MSGNYTASKGVYLIIRQRLTKFSQLRDSNDFKQAFQQGSKFRQGCVTTYAKSNNLGYPRLGLSITKKALPHATSRNRVKRIIRESFRLNQTLLLGLDIVVVVASQCLSNKQILSCDLDKQWSRLVYYKKV